jgi:exodeoxyribonuclease VII small subunit
MVTGRATGAADFRPKGPTMSDTPVADMTFEQAMAELEQVVGRLERGDVALDESITLYERGAALKKRCDSKLKEAEEKVAAITLDADGEPSGLKPVEGL